MRIIKEEGRALIKAWVDTRQKVVPGALIGHEWGQPVYGDDKVVEVPNIEDGALEQLRNIATLPFLHQNGLAVMPDVHKGIGATVGSVIATVGAVVPAAVGVDLGCGMNAVRTSLKASDLPDSLSSTRAAIEAAIPVGFGGGSEHKAEQGMGELELDALEVIADLMGEDRHRLMSKAAKQIGSLGSGNHFIEVCLDESQNVWVMLHSGSRGIGNIIGRHYIERAKRQMERFFISLPDKDLAYLPEDTQDFEEYVRAVRWAQDYALANRSRMMHRTLEEIGVALGRNFALTGEAVNCHHNYIARENHFGQNLWVTRKGAVSAREGQAVIIPGSMGQRSYIAVGRGHPESYCSCSHGAGRVMSRTAAKKAFRVDDLIAQTAGVECRKDASILDEIPAAYKDIDQVMANQSDLVEIRHTLKQILCVKGS